MSNGIKVGDMVKFKVLDTEHTGQVVELLSFDQVAVSVPGKGFIYPRAIDCEAVNVNSPAQDAAQHIGSKPNLSVFERQIVEFIHKKLADLAVKRDKSPSGSELHALYNSAMGELAVLGVEIEQGEHRKMEV